MSRYDFSETLVRMFYVLDRNLTTSFSDIPQYSRYYPYIASGEHAGLIGGVGDGLFAGERVMTRQEAVTLAARALANQKGYEFPAAPAEYLAAFSDAGEISEWAHAPVSLTAREGIIGTGGSFAPRRDITRAEAATILYRLFLLLYETPPVAVEMTPLSSGGGAGSRADDAAREGRRQTGPEEEAQENGLREEGAPSSILTIALGISIGVLVAGAGTATVIIIIRKKDT